MITRKESEALIQIAADIRAIRDYLVDQPKEKAKHGAELMKRFLEYNDFTELGRL